MKKLRALLLMLAIVCSLFLCVACNGDPDGEKTEGGDPYLDSYGENIVDYDALS